MNRDCIDCTREPPPVRDCITIDGISLSYLEWRSHGPTVLLLHGITSSARAWWRVAPALVTAGYHVYALDMPGHGASALTKNHQIDYLAAIVSMVMSALAFSQVTLIGHSWGGATALMLASDSTSGCTRVQRVVLIDPSMRMSAAWGTEALPRFLYGVGKAPAETCDPLRAANSDWHECDIIWKASALQQCRAEAVRGFFTQSGSWELTPHLAQIYVPLLFMIADPRYSVVAPEIVKAVKHTLQSEQGRIVMLPNTNHNIYRGGYNAFMDTLLHWLEDTDQS